MTDTEPRIAVLESRADQHEAEMARTRDRLHLLETSNAVLQMLVQQVAEIRTDVKSLLGTQAGDAAVRKWKWSAATLALMLLAAVATFVVYYHP